MIYWKNHGSLIFIQLSSSFKKKIKISIIFDYSFFLVSIFEKSRKCVLFSNETSGKGNFVKVGALVNKPFINWKNVLECFTTHSNADYHKCWKLYTIVLSSIRINADIEFQILFLEVEQKLNLLDETIQILRITGCQLSRSNTSAESPEQYYKRTIFIPFIDFLKN